MRSKLVQQRNICKGILCIFKPKNEGCFAGGSCLIMDPIKKGSWTLTPGSDWTLSDGAKPFSGFFVGVLETSGDGEKGPTSHRNETATQTLTNTQLCQYSPQGDPDKTLSQCPPAPSWHFFWLSAGSRCYWPAAGTFCPPEEKTHTGRSTSLRGGSWPPSNAVFSICAHAC